MICYGINVKLIHSYLYLFIYKIIHIIFKRKIMQWIKDGHTFCAILFIEKLTRILIPREIASMLEVYIEWPH